MDPFGHLVGLLGRGISPTQGLYLHRTTQYRKSRTHVHAPSRIRTCDPNVQAAEDSTCRRPHGHWDRQFSSFHCTIFALRRNILVGWSRILWLVAFIALCVLWKVLHFCCDQQFLISLLLSLYCIRSERNCTYINFLPVSSVLNCSCKTCPSLFECLVPDGSLGGYKQNGACTYIRADVFLWRPPVQTWRTKRSVLLALNNGRINLCNWLWSHLLCLFFFIILSPWHVDMCVCLHATLSRSRNEDHWLVTLVKG
jgi:hypothetical protein